MAGVKEICHFPGLKASRDCRIIARCRVREPRMAKRIFPRSVGPELVGSARPSEGGSNPGPGRGITPHQMSVNVTKCNLWNDYCSCQSSLWPCRLPSILCVSVVNPNPGSRLADGKNVRKTKCEHLKNAPKIRVNKPEQGGTSPEIKKVGALHRHPCHGQLRIRLIKIN